MKKRIVKELKRLGIILCMMSLLAGTVLNVAAAEVEDTPEYEVEDDFDESEIPEEDDTQNDVEIVKQSLKDAKVELSELKYICDGTAKEPEVTVKLEEKELVEDTDYEVTYSKNINPGTAFVEVEGIGNYEGELKETFIIMLDSPVITETTSSAVDMKVKFEPVYGATRYDLLRSTSEDSGYTKVASLEVDEDTVLELVDKKVTFNAVYYYKVRAFYSGPSVMVYGIGSEAKEQRVHLAKAVMSKTSSVTASSLKVQWAKVEKSDGYEIYRSEEADGEYTKVGSVKGVDTLNYTDTGLVFGKIYHYKVRAYRNWEDKVCYGPLSEALAGNTTPDKVILTDKTTYDATSITLCWQKSAGADGYEIYRSLKKDSGYEIVENLTSGDSLTWTDSGLEKGKTYYYKVRAYGSYEERLLYGAYSSVYTKRPGGWRYENGYKLYYNEKGKLVKDVSSIIGKQSSYVLKVNRTKNTVTVYAKDGDNGYILPVKAFICSTGNATPTGTYYTPAKFRWLELMGPCWGQWNTQIVGDFLFHSVYYDSYNNNNTLNVSAYNKLGTTCSHGCIRLTAGDAKWIYDNCSLKTKVVLYNGDSPGPLGKPTAYKLESWHTWDPTDPNMKSKCDSRGCH